MSSVFRSSAPNILKPRVENLFDILLLVVQQDNEMNGIVAMQSLADLFKTFSGDLLTRVPVFLQFAASMQDILFIGKLQGACCYAVH